MAKPDAMPSASTNHPDGLFATTHGSVVLSAGGTESSQSRRSLEYLCKTYWYPIYGHVRRRGNTPNDAQDLVQSFFAALLERSPKEEGCGLIFAVRDFVAETA